MPSAGEEDQLWKFGGVRKLTADLREERKVIQESGNFNKRAIILIRLKM